MNLDELKKLREANILAHKKKKNAYYLKKKAISSIEITKNIKVIDYEKEFSEANFLEKIKEIAKVQKKHVDMREEIIKKKVDEYKNKKKEYYEENKEKRLEYDKEYRERKKEELKEYRRSYYKKNKQKILEKQKNKKKPHSKE